MKKVCFILSYKINPRMRKRIELLENDFDISLIWWNRGGYTKIQDLKHVKKYMLSYNANSGKPLKRVLPTIKFLISSIRVLRKLSPEILYVENLDMLIIANIYKLFFNRRVKTIYEVADLHHLIYGNSKSLVSRVQSFIVRIIDKVNSKFVHLFVSTSDLFYTNYYGKFISDDKYIFVPNIPDFKPFLGYKKNNNDVFTIGFIGVIRYFEQIKMLIDVSGITGVNLFFAGEEKGFTADQRKGKIETFCEGKENIEYFGPYDYNTQIAELYSHVDCMYSVYDADLLNVRIALPNRLYESIYCKIPILVSKGTYLAEIVEELGIGIAVNHVEPDDLISVIVKMMDDTEYYNTLSKNCEKNYHYIDKSISNNKLLSSIIRL